MKKIGAKRIAWGESADVLLLPKKLARKGGRVLRIERRMWGNRKRLNKWEALPNYWEMKFANLLFPENVIKMTHVEAKERPVFKGKGVTPRYFSKYYPLPLKTRKEMIDIRKRIEMAHKGKADRSAVFEEVMDFDERMRKAHPHLAPTASELEKAGVIIPHPEVNFTVHKGKIMFYKAKLDLNDDYEKVTKAIFKKVTNMEREKAREFLIEATKALCMRDLSMYARKKLDPTLYSQIYSLMISCWGKGYITEQELSSLNRALSFASFRANNSEVAEEIVKNLRLEK